jgi:tetratricopeptide (TPR) repeat protein
MGDFKEAIKCFSVAIELESGKADFYHNRGFAYRKNRDYEHAIADYTKAIKLDDSHFKAFYNRAFCYDKQSKLY